MRGSSFFIGFGAAVLGLVLVTGCAPPAPAETLDGTVTQNTASGQTAGSAVAGDAGARGDMAAGSAEKAAPAMDSAAAYTTPADTYERIGRYLETKQGEPMIVIENTGPVSLFYCGSDEHVFDSLENGDLISAQTGLIRETYPGQAEIYSLQLLEKGSMQDIDPYTLDRLDELGWIER